MDTLHAHYLTLIATPLVALAVSFLVGRQRDACPGRERSGDQPDKAPGCIPPLGPA
jgi:hypothetical protein